MTKIWATHPGSKVLGHLDVFLPFPSSAHDEDWVVPRTLKCEMGCPLKPGREAQPGSPHGVICLVSGPGALVSEILVSLLLAVYSKPDRFQASGEARAPC